MTKNDRYFCAINDFTVSTGMIANTVVSNIQVIKNTLWKLVGIEKRGEHTILFLLNERSECEIGVMEQDCRMNFDEIIDVIDDVGELLS